MTRPQIRAPKQLQAGIFYVIVGASFFLGAQGYGLGTSLKMGAGYFPAVVGAVLFLLGLVSIAQGLFGETAAGIEKHDVVPLIFVCAGVVSFALLIKPAGLLVALGALILIACFPRARTNPFEVLLLYIVLAAFSWFLFIYMFGMDMSLLPDADLAS
jgi:hypothetical protein